MKLIKRLICLIAALQLTACAFGTRTVELSYPPEQESKPANAVPIESHPVRFSGKEIRLEVSDARYEKKRVGNMRNTYGMDTANIISNDSVEGWVQSALVYELGLRGVSVVTPDSTGSDSETPQLMVDIHKAYCDVYAFYDAEVTLKGGLWYGNQLQDTGIFPAQVNSGLSFFGTGKSVGLSLSLALEKSIQQMLAKLGFADAPIQAEP